MKITNVFATAGKKPVNLNYFLTTPKDFDPQKECLPLIVFLHGAGERGDNIELVKKHGVPKLFDRDQDYMELRVITLSPQCPTGTVWNHLVYNLMELIDSIAVEYNADKKKISLTGISMGGFGTWEMGMTFTNYFSAYAPICGGGQSWRAAVLNKKPIRAFHGETDSVVPVIYTKDIIEVIKKAGGNPEVTYYEGVEHDSWTVTYEQTDLIKWLSEQINE